MQNLHELRHTLTSQGALICFNGPFSHSIIEELGKAVRKYLEAEEMQKSDLMDVFSVYIEATQNVSNYANREERQEQERTRLNAGIIVIGREGDRYAVLSGNLVHPEDGEALRQRLDRLAALDKAGLKALYKEQMRNKLGPGSSGAGLGLIDMARKAKAPLEYALVPEQEGLTFFSLKVLV
ncbi:MAG: SiaB family protein kinase [Holophaga sp.]|nr:SiaB family protein kinase [Holophaga sp.]